METLSVVTNAIVAMLYPVLGLIILPRIIRVGRSWATALLSRVSLGVFAVGCAVTHAELALHAGDGTETQQLIFFLFALPQLIGGAVFLAAALLYKDLEWVH